MHERPIELTMAAWQKQERNLSIDPDGINCCAHKVEHMLFSENDVLLAALCKFLCRDERLGVHSMLISIYVFRCISS